MKRLRELKRMSSEKVAMASIVLTVCLAGCSSVSMSLPSMPLAEREALGCKHNLHQMSEHYSRTKGPLKEHSIQGFNEMKCPVAGEATYSKSLKAGVGKPGKELVIYCAGRHHLDAGYQEDYPRWVAGEGFFETEKGQKVPSGLQLPLPEDVEVVESYERQGTVYVTFKTAEDAKQLNEKYHQLLNPGTQNVFAERNGRIGSSGKIGAIPYGVSFDLEKNTFTVAWDPAVSVPQTE
jgi:hypothetical protein